MTLIRYSVLAGIVGLLFSSPVLADDGCDGGCRGNRSGYDRGHHTKPNPHRNRHYAPRRQHVSRHYNRPRTHVRFNFGTAPYYPTRYYQHPRVMYSPVPVAPQPQVIYINNDNSRQVSMRDGRYCREYSTVINVGGRGEHTYGTACMQPDGSWQIIN